MMKKRFFWLLLILLSSYDWGYAQEGGWRPLGTNLHYEEGDWISYSDPHYVRSIALGNYYIYFATSGGITRYEFYRNRWDFPFTTSNGLPDNEVYTVAFDQGTSYLWCSTPQGVSYYEPTSQRWRNIYYDEMGLAPSDYVTSIGFSTDEVFLVTASGKVLRARKLSEVFTPVDTLELETDVWNNIQWFGEKGFRPFQLPLFHMRGTFLFYPDPTRGYIEDGNLRRYPITYYVEDPWDYLWVGTWGLGAAVADLKIRRLSLLQYGLLGTDVQAMALDGSSLWVGGINRLTPLKGITYWNRKTDEWRYFEARLTTGLLSDDVLAITVDGSRVWFGTLEGLALYEKGRGEWRTYTVFDGLSDNTVYDVVVDSAYVWIATEDGLDRLLKASLRTDSLIVEHIPLEEAPGKVAFFDLEWDGSVLWAATNQGVFVYDGTLEKGGFYIGAQGPTAEVITSVSSSGEEIWFGTLDGVEVFDKRQKKWKGPPERQFLTKWPVLDICATPEVIWVGTERGVYKFDRNRRYWRLFNEEDGLIHPRVQSILPDGDYVWFGTPRGLTRFYWNDPTRID